MKFLKGNKAGLGNENSGRPRKYDIEDLAKKLEEWSESKDAFNILQFCAKHSFASEYISVWAKQSDAFSQSLKIAKVKLGARQAEMLQRGKYNHGDYQRQLGYYNKALHEFEREEQAHEYMLKKGLESKDVNITVNNIDYSKASKNGE